jgi:hypothetical protein
LGAKNETGNFWVIKNIINVPIINRNDKLKFKVLNDIIKEQNEQK